MSVSGFFKRKILKLYARIVREKASSGYIARGWAIGMFCGCFIPFGLQLAVSIPASFIMRGSKIGATLGTFLTNHFTIFFIYPAQCYVGNILMGSPVSWDYIKQAMDDVLVRQSFQSLFEKGAYLAISFFIGGAILAGVMTPLTYYAVKKFVEQRRSRIRKKAAKEV